MLASARLQRVLVSVSVQEDRVLSDGRRVLQHDGVSDAGDAGGEPVGFG